MLGGRGLCAQVSVVVWLCGHAPTHPRTSLAFPSSLLPPHAAGWLLVQLSRALRDAARAIPGKAQLFMAAYAKALEVIPRQLCDNAGIDATDVLNRLRQKHALADGSGKV